MSMVREPGRLVEEYSTCPGRAAVFEVLRAADAEEQKAPGVPERQGCVRVIPRLGEQPQGLTPSPFVYPLNPHPAPKRRSNHESSCTAPRER